MTYITNIKRTHGRGYTPYKRASGQVTSSVINNGWLFVTIHTGGPHGLGRLSVRTKFYNDDHIEAFKVNSYVSFEYVSDAKRGINFLSMET